MVTKKARVIHSRVGPLHVEQERLILFPKGLLGFETQRDFALVRLQEDSAFFLLQSCTDPQLGLMVADPYVYLPDYRIKISTAEQELLRLKTIREAVVLVTVTIPPGKPEDAVLNLVGPLVVNIRLRRGLQIPQNQLRHPPRLHLAGDRPEDESLPCKRQ
ncbi:flagellar assembly protein FliW [Desulfonatronum thioautotrophicum]|uniref:flagellar assembly protein FliW n=1 Tax=Desulfonatronum thioautotrophicum TaxID=617001 RepID=UPI0005EB45DB|nr:flagellar assembly protein FliW [Desulfonatronum thioautotrophicum]